MSVNKVIVLGRVGQDPELKHTPSGSAVCNFSVATNETWNDKTTGKKHERVEWHRVVVWGKLAEQCNTYLSKGRQCYVEGKLETRSWEDKNNQKRYTTEVKANTVQFIGGNAEKNEALKQADDKKAEGYDISTDASFASSDIPF